MDNEDSGDFSDELDEFEESRDEKQTKKMNDMKYSNKPYDEAFEISQDLSVAESFDGRDKKSASKAERQSKLQNDRYDEAVDVSQSIDQFGTAASSKGKPSITSASAASAKDSAPTLKDQKGTTLTNRPYDEAVDVSDDESFASNGSDEKGYGKKAGSSAQQAGKPEASLFPSQSVGGLERPGPTQSQQTKPLTSNPPSKIPEKRPSPTGKGKDDEEASEGSGEEDAGEESYENLEGAYNPKDYASLNVTADVKDLFQYIERFKPHEKELDVTMKCFIPEYIPAIGEMDSFLKIPRADKREDDLGLKYLDEPASVQSDPTVLELQLRAKSKKQQYGDVIVRSIENASKNPAAIDKWIQSISDLHRSKPPPQVHYRRPMPDTEQLMDVWPEDFESALQHLQLPSPDLDLSLADYSKLLCSLLDIPTYENPIESLHLLFSLYTDFRNNPHFQALREKGGGTTDTDGIAEQKRDMMYGGADVMEINQGFK